MDQEQKLFTAEFLILNIIFFFAATVMAVFFQFQHYLGSLGIASAWLGFLIAADSLASFILQPFLSVYLNAGNARKWLFTGIFGMAVMLFSYGFALSLPLLIAVRVFHGAAFVCLISAIMAIIVDYIPSQKSGQAFGLISIVRLLPYSIVPPIVTMIDKTPSDFRTILVYGAFLMLISLVPAFKIKVSSPAGQSAASGQQQINMQELSDDLKNKDIAVLFAVSLLLYSSYTVVFFFIKEYSHTRGIENPGYFFTIATAVMIGVRLFGGTFFDKVNKLILTMLCMAGLAVCYVLLSHISGVGMFYTLAFFIGLGWGIVMPVIYALIFDLSLPRFRGMNLNLSFVMMQGGFFIGPFLGGALLNHWGYNALFYFCGVLSILAAALLYMIMQRRQT